MRPRLYIGNKRYSSWSMRPWLALRWGQIGFDEVVVPLGGEGYGSGAIRAVRAVSPTGQVPVLHVDDLVVADSLAIAEWAAERAGPGVLWPVRSDARALGRAATCEMHAGFGAIRRELSHNLGRRLARPPPLSDRADAELARLFDLWAGLLDRFGGPWLLGARSIADAFYTPVASRLRTYAIRAPAQLVGYVDRLLGDPDLRAWEEAALAEP